MLNKTTIRGFALCAAIVFAGTEIVVHADRALAQEKHDKQEKPKFDSPFNGKRDLDGEEGKAFSALMDAYDKMKDAEAELQSAKACKGNIQKAQKELDDATAAFNKLLEQYVIDWSSYINIQQEKWRVQAEAKKVMDALAKQDKKQHGAKCPEKGAVKKHHKATYSEDDPRFMEGFRPKPQPSTPSQTPKPTYNGPVYVVPPPKEPGDENNKSNNDQHNPYNPTGMPNYP